MISPTVNFLSENEPIFHSIDYRLASQKLIRYATALCTERTYNTYLIHQCDPSKDYAILKIYNAVKIQFENHIMVYDQANHRILLETLNSATPDAPRVFSSISDMIKELDSPLLDQIVEVNFCGSTLMGVHHRCLTEENERSEGFIASTRVESLDEFFGPDTAPAVPDAAPMVSAIPNAVSTVSSTTPNIAPAVPNIVINGRFTATSTSSTSSTISSTTILTSPTHIASAKAALVEEKAEMREKIRDSEIDFSQIVTNDPHYTLKTKRELEAEWTKTPNHIHYAFGKGPKPRIFILSFSIPDDPIRHYKFKATKKGFKLNKITTVCKLDEVVSHFFLLASLEV